MVDIVAQVIRTQGLELVDAQGRVRGRLELSGGQPVLALYDNDGKTRAQMILGEHGDPAVELLDEKGLIRASLSFDRDARSSVSVPDEGEEARGMAWLPTNERAVPARARGDETLSEQEAGRGKPDFRVYVVHKEGQALVELATRPPGYHKVTYEFDPIQAAALGLAIVTNAIKATTSDPADHKKLGVALRLLATTLEAG